MTFIPNRTCGLRRKNGVNGFGEPSFDSKITVPFALVRFDTKVEDSTVRADSSATRGNVKEFHASGRALFPVSVVPKWGDIIVIDNKVFMVKEVEPRYHVLGNLDHYEVDFEKYEDIYGDEV